MNINQLLKKEGWTGRELGILELTNVAVMFGKALSGEPDPKPIISQEQLRTMTRTIKDPVQGRIYNGYLSIHEWLSVMYNIANANFMQAQLQYKSLTGYIIQAHITEKHYRYIEQLPRVMTQKQYDEAVAHAREAISESNCPLRHTAAALIIGAFNYYQARLTADAKKANPLKAIRKQYINAPVESRLILDNYCAVTESGEYYLPDGRRLNELSREERNAIIFPSYTEDEQIKRHIFRAKGLYEGLTEQELDNLQERLDIKSGRLPELEWRADTEPPTDLCKWDMLEDTGSLQEFYPHLFDMGLNYSEWGEDDQQKAVAEALDFAAEFKELIAALIADIDKHSYFDFNLADIPVEEYSKPLVSWAVLYDKNYYDFQDFINAPHRLFDGDARAVFNGVAILRPSPFNSRSIVADGRYQEPDATEEASDPHSLLSFFQESEQYAERAEEIEEGRAALKDSYYFIKGYNTAVDLIAQHFGVPELAVFKLDLKKLENQIIAYNAYVPVLYQQISNTRYEDETLKKRKLEVLKDFFPEIDYEALIIPQEKIDKAVELFEDFKGFADSSLRELLCTRPREGDGYEQ